MFVSALLAATLAAPVPKAKAVELYFPTVEGTKWVKQTKWGDETTEETHTVTKVMEKEGVFTVSTISSARKLGGEPREYEYEVSAKGVFTVSNSNGKLPEPEPLLKMPAKEGDTWTSERPWQNGIKVTHTVGKQEEVEVPAGKYKAIVVHSEYTWNGRLTKWMSWYAVGVGEVKHIYDVDGKNEWVRKLKEFTHPKAK